MSRAGSPGFPNLLVTSTSTPVEFHEVALPCVVLILRREIPSYNSESHENVLVSELSKREELILALRGTG